MHPTSNRLRSTVIRVGIAGLVAGAMTLGFGFGASAAGAFEPAGEPAQEHFGCVNGVTNAVAGHPGASGLTHSAPLVNEKTGNPLPTAWNAVNYAEPIDFGSC